MGRIGCLLIPAKSTSRNAKSQLQPAAWSGMQSRSRNANSARVPGLGSGQPQEPAQQGPSPLRPDGLGGDRGALSDARGGRKSSHPTTAPHPLRPGSVGREKWDSSFDWPVESVRVAMPLSGRPKRPGGADRRTVTHPRNRRSIQQETRSAAQRPHAHAAPASVRGGGAPTYRPVSTHEISWVLGISRAGGLMVEGARLPTTRGRPAQGGWSSGRPAWGDVRGRPVRSPGRGWVTTATRGSSPSPTGSTSSVWDGWPTGHPARAGQRSDQSARRPEHAPPYPPEGPGRRPGLSLPQNFCQVDDRP